MKITYTNEVLNAHHGQTDCEAGIYVDGEIMGYVQYVLYGNELTISDILVRPEERRKGYASRLVKYILQENPGYKYEESMKTTDGSNFKHKDLPLVSESVENFLKPKSKEEIAHLEQKFEEYKDRINDIHPLIRAYNTNEWNQVMLKYFDPESEEDMFESGVHLIVTDSHELEDENLQILGGSYSVEMKPDGDIVAHWDPYPEEPIVGIDNLVEHLTDLAADYEYHIETGN